jgi:hypothetical protein
MGGRRAALALALVYQLACVYECGSHGEAYGEATARGGALGGDPDAETPSQRLAQWRALRHAATPGSNAAAEAEKGKNSGEESGDGLGTRLREWRSQRRSGERREERPEVLQEPAKVPVRPKLEDWTIYDGSWERMLISPQDAADGVMHVNDAALCQSPGDERCKYLCNTHLTLSLSLLRESERENCLKSLRSFEVNHFIFFFFTS